MVDGETHPSVVTFGDYTLRLAPAALLKGGRPVKLQAQPMRLLTLLAHRRGEVVSHDEIYRRLWGDQVLDHAGGVHVCIRQIRAALGDDAASPRYIFNVPRRGYMFAAPDGADKPLMTPALRHVTPVRAGVAAGATVIVAIAAAMFLDDSHFTPAAPAPTSQSPARDSFLRGRYLLDLQDQNAARESRAFFARAIETDSGFAPAYAAMAESFQRTGEFANSRTYAEKAVALNPGLADAHLRLGASYFFKDWNWSEAERRLQAAIALDESLVEARHGLAAIYAVTGRLADAVEQMEIALSIDPASTLLQADYGYFLYYAGHYDAAITQCGDMLMLDAASAAAMRCRIKAARQKGDDAAMSRFAASYMRHQDTDEAAIERIAGAHSPAEGVAAFDQWRMAEAERLKASGDAVSPAHQAFLEIALGDADAAMDNLRLALEQRDDLLPILLLDPELTPLYGRADFDALLAEAGVVKPARPTKTGL